jgi:hypothetical protein
MQSLKRGLKRYPRLYAVLGRAKRLLFSSPPQASQAQMIKIPLPTFTAVQVGRFLFFKRLLDLLNDVEGDVVECGVGRGRSLLLLALLCREEEKGRQIWGFDSFEGLPEPSEEDASPRNPRKGQYRADIAGVRALLQEAQLDDLYMRSKVTLVKGVFNESLHKYAGQGIALLHIDADLYQSYLDTLNILYDKVRPGGVIAFDEYMDGITHVNYPGAKQAIDEFFADKPFELRRDKHYGKYYVIKPRA